MDTYFIISTEGEQVGPIPGEQLINHAITPKTLVWGQKMSGWTPAENVPELAAMFADNAQQNPDIEVVAVTTENGDSPEAETGTEQPLKTKHSTGRYWVLIVLLTIGVIALGILYFMSRNKYDRDTSSLRNNVSTLEQERDKAVSDLTEFKSSVSSVYPIIITDILIGNVNKNNEVDIDFGNSIPSYKTMYLEPRIKYTGLTDGTINLKVKWYCPDGTIRRGSSSPAGFSQSESIYINEGADNSVTLQGWGNESRGHWGSGTHRIEIWHNNICLKAKEFNIL